MADSKFLKAESLLELIKAVMWASGPVMRIAASGERSDIAEVLGRSCGSLLYMPRLHAQSLHALGPHQCARRS